MLIDTPLGEDFLVLKEFSASETISELFSFQLKLVHEENTEGLIPTVVGRKLFWGSGENSLPNIRETFLEQIPDQYFVFAEGNAGDQICIHLENHQIYYWHHESPEGADLFLTANSFENFIKSLEINKSDVADDSDLEEEWFADDF